MNNPQTAEFAGQKVGYFDNMLIKQQSISKAADVALKRLSEAKTDDVTEIAASQIELLSQFYDLSLSQAGRSFRWALIASVVGLLFLLAAIAFQMMNGDGELAVVTLIGGALIEFIAGINFYLYGKTLSQLTLFQGRLEVTQRFLLANSLCEKLGAEYKDKTRAELIARLASNEPYRDYSPDKAGGHRGQRRLRRTARDTEADPENNPVAGHM